MFVRKSWIAILVCVLCHSGLAVAQRPDPAIGSNWPNGTWATAVVTEIVQHFGMPQVVR